MLTTPFKTSCRDPDGSDTESTDDDCNVGGLGIYSHGKKCLTHQHWVSQCVTAGGFNVNCTQGPEAAHVVNMHLASVRVRHRDPNITQHSMLGYLGFMQLFDELSADIIPVSRITRRAKAGIRAKLLPTFPDASGEPPGSTRYLQAFIHKEARVTGAELLDMICLHLGLPQTRPSRLKIGSSVDFGFGQQFVRQDGIHFWGTDSGYGPGRRGSSRHDMLWVKGFEGRNALCAEIVCFVHVSNVDRLQLPGFENSFDLVLVRWLEPHGDAWQRDGRGLPVCSGPLQVNNCLWKYSRTPTPRHILRSPPARALRRQLYMFGSNRDEIQIRCEQEKYAFYGLIGTDNILDRVNMCNTFVPNTSTPKYDTFLQSVCMI